MTDHVIHTHPPHTKRASREQAPDSQDLRHFGVFSILYLNKQGRLFKMSPTFDGTVIIKGYSDDDMVDSNVCITTSTKLHEYTCNKSKI